MAAYEILLMLDAELADERQDEILSRMREQIERDGTWESHDVWGRRKLAYEIDHKGEAVYHLVTFDTGAETLAEVSRVLKITDGVMRHLAVRRLAAGQAPSGPPPEDTIDDPAASTATSGSRERE